MLKYFWKLRKDLPHAWFLEVILEESEVSVAFSCIDLFCGMDTFSGPAVSSSTLLNTEKDIFKRKGLKKGFKDV